MTASLTLETYDSPARPLNLPIPLDPPEGGWTWPPTSVTLISGQREAVLVDTLATLQDSQGIADWVEGTGKELRSIYVTHAHLDHFIGLSVLLSRFPRARVIATEPTCELMRAEQASGAERAAYSPLFVDEVPQELVLPEPVKDGKVELEGHVIHAVPTGRSDVSASSYLHLPSLRAAIVGDIAYADVHPTLIGSDRASREAWIRTIRGVQELDLKVVVASHRAKDSVNDAGVLEDTITYLEDANRLLSGRPTASEFIADMLALHPTRQNPTTLYYGALALGLTN